MDWNLSTAARTMYQEARGEPLDGQKAVAHAITNRVKDGRWGTSLGSVCLSRNQFSAWGPVEPTDKNMLADFRDSCAKTDDDPEIVYLAGLLQKALDGEPDPTGGGTHYYNPKEVKTKPSFALPPSICCGQFGQQMFYRNVP